VYFYCGRELVPVLRQLPPSAEALTGAVKALIKGTTQSERRSGLDGVFPEPDAIVHLKKSPQALTVDLDSSTFKLERFLAGAVFFKNALVRTSRANGGPQSVHITVDGRPLCAVDEECVQPRAKPTGKVQ
jgi:hypothetical protein